MGEGIFIGTITQGGARSLLALSYYLSPLRGFLLVPRKRAIPVASVARLHFAFSDRAPGQFVVPSVDYWLDWAWLSLRIKICGITDPSGARAAVDAGADALGFIFYSPSPRAISLGAAAEIIRSLPPLLAKVGVFVDASEDFVRQAIDECGLDTLQFHGNESPEFCRQFALKSIKAFRVRGPESLRDLPKHADSAWLLDSFVPDKFGGTGAGFDWELAREAKTLGGHIILAGGLSPENVAEAVGKVRPFAVDVSSGVEDAPGKKNHGKVRSFVLEARRAAESNR